MPPSLLFRWDASGRLKKGMSGYALSGVIRSFWVNRVVLTVASTFRSTPINGHQQAGPVGPVRAMSRYCVGRRLPGCQHDGRAIR
jgi:hypothetical protein